MINLFYSPRLGGTDCPTFKASSKVHVLPECLAIFSLELHSTSVTCRGYCACLVLKRMMPLRCLLFSSNAEVVQPIWQVLADLGIEGEHCQSAVDAVEKVTTQSFQIVITDWEDQPEAAFLLKTVRDLKASQRPLTLAIVSGDARRPQALQAGANSILLKPIRAEQVRDTMSTACELLRSKLQPTASVPAREASGTMALAAAASAGAVSLPASVRRTPERIRAGEFLRSPSAAPGAQFNTESEAETSKEATVAKVSAVTDLEPIAAATNPSAPAQLKPQETLTGWAMLQARLTTAVPRAAASAGPNSELLSYGETRSYRSPSAATSASDAKAPAKKDSREDSDSEAKLLAYMPGPSSQGSGPVATARPRRAKSFVLAALAVIFVGLVALPRTRKSVLAIYRNSVAAGNRLLNPPPPALPQAVAMHDSFGQSGDEYDLPLPTNIPDATTDPSQIRVLPMIDPTAKPPKNLDANTSPEQAPSLENPHPDQDQVAPNQSSQGQHEVRDAAPTSNGEVPRNPTETRTNAVPAQTESIPSTRVVQSAAVQTPTQAPRSVPQHAISAGAIAGIPSSLKSHLASSLPQSSGSRPVEAAMSSIEPVNLPEPVEREFLIQPVDAIYPASARASRQAGTVVLQVLVARDGSIQDAKFLQGSLVFARAAIDAVKQYRYKPYSLNGRPVSVQSVITLNFKPPA
jgi:periplasmic protein TonB